MEDEFRGVLGAAAGDDSLIKPLGFPAREAFGFVVHQIPPHREGRLGESQGVFVVRGGFAHDGDAEATKPGAVGQLREMGDSWTKFDKGSQSVYPPAMNISLTPELEHAIEAKVKSGLYHDASEVVREALRQSLAQEREHAWLARKAAIGFAQLESGQTMTVESKEQFLALVREEA